MVQYFSKPSKMVASPPNITVTWLNQTTVNISSTTLARSVYLFDKTRQPLLLEDNYFDILPGGFRVVDLLRPVAQENLRWKEYFTERQLSLQESIDSIES